MFGIVVVGSCSVVVGVNTRDILTFYVSAIRALRVLDPAGVLLDLVCQPVRAYLRYVTSPCSDCVMQLIQNSKRKHHVGTNFP